MGKLGNVDFFSSDLMNENTQIESDAFSVEGQVKWFDAVKGFGFVLSDDGGPDILLHANVLRNFGQGSVADASRIELMVQRTERGLQAIEVIGITPPELEEDQEDIFAVDVDLDDVDLTPARVKWFDKAKGFGFANAYGHSDDIFLHVEDDAKERAVGLMNRPSMPTLSGMLFVYDKPDTLTFWMRNTLIKLDMIFIAPNGTISHIHENAIPLDETAVSGGAGNLAVLEINGGLAKRFGISVGDVVQHGAFSSTNPVWPCE